MTTPRKKLIEVSIPLEAINKASAREKSIRHGHPSTLHLWWARRPLAACRAVLFAQLVDDPSSWPEKFPTETEQETERRRLHKVIEDMVPWEASNDETILNAARWEIARSVAWGLGEEPPARGDGKAILDYLQTKAPPVYDPFSGGGSIPLEAQRLGLRAYGSDLNPVAVLIGKALVEIPPKFAGRPPVNPKSQAEIRNGGRWNGKGAQGVAEDVRYYGQWMRDEAEKRIGHLYPKAKLPDGSEAAVIAWLWARTVRSPDPAAKGAMVPLVSSFMLGTKEGKKAWAAPVIDPSADDGWRFTVHTGSLSKEDEKVAAEGTKSGRANFRCLLTGANINGAYIDHEARLGHLSSRIIAIIAEGTRSRHYLAADAAQEAAPRSARDFLSTTTSGLRLPDQECRGTFASNAMGRRYCFETFADYFTSRQLIAITTLSDLVNEARTMLISDLQDRQSTVDTMRLGEGGTGPVAYADAIATYLSFLVTQLTNHSASVCGWNSANTQMRSVFSRQAITMTWDFAEVNVFSESSGSLKNLFDRLVKAFEGLPANAGLENRISAKDAAKNSYADTSVVICTDPPYYGNIAYADLSDFFYVWMRRNLAEVWPDLLRRLLTPKDEELVATPYRHGGHEAAEAFFMRGMSEALAAMRRAATDAEPLTVFYAFKQSESSAEGITSAGWASFLQAVVDAELVVDGTWPIDTEKKGRSVGIGANALASSVVLVCRKRGPSADVITRADFIRILKGQLPAAIDAIRKAGVGPVDMQQSVIGPGMGVFSRHAQVLEDDDSPMPVKTALSIINRVWEEIDNELVATLDPETQVALAWFGSYGFDARGSGELITLANAKNIPSDSLFASGVFDNQHGKVALIPREKLSAGWSPAKDKTPTVWECVQHLVRVLRAEGGGVVAAAQLLGEMGPKAADVRALLDRLFRIATEKGWAAEALVYNQLAEEWPHLVDHAASMESAIPAVGTGDLFAR